MSPLYLADFRPRDRTRRQNAKGLETRAALPLKVKHLPRSMAGMRLASCLAMDGQVQTMVRLPPSREALVPMENVQGLSLWLRSVANSEVLEEIKARRRREIFGI